MSFNFENQLDIIDKQLSAKQDKEVYLIYAMIVGIFGFISYYFLFEPSELAYQKSFKTVEAIKKNIADDQQYLRFNPEGRITQIEANIKNLEQDFEEYKKANEYIKYQIEQISELFYDEKSWGAYIDSISIHAKDNEIKLLHLSNKFSEDKSAFGHVLDIEVEALGKYRDLLKFTNLLEQSDLVVDIHTIDLKTDEDKKLMMKLKISVWGITY
jgi:predicted RNase H-like nuclease (RuvC/YqgF family)